MIRKILDFLRLWKIKRALLRSETAIASEAVLGRDWLSSEEEDAWRELSE